MLAIRGRFEGPSWRAPNTGHNEYEYRQFRRNRADSILIAVDAMARVFRTISLVGRLKNDIVAQI
jgi:hypothetical protein